jgi:predicted Zn-ribbon and HTH transcriptional regulator
MLLEKYNIQSRTVLPEFMASALTATERIMEIPDTDDGLRAALMAAGVKPMICQEKGKKENKELVENKKRLQKVADKMGMKLVFIPSRDG